MGGMDKLVCTYIILDLCSPCGLECYKITLTFWRTRIIILFIARIEVKHIIFVR